MASGSLLAAALSACILTLGLTCANSAGARDSTGPADNIQTPDKDPPMYHAPEPPATPWPEDTAPDCTLHSRDVYRRDNLSDYVNGGAALYLAYSFEWLAVWRVGVGEETRETVVELYRFAFPEDALGVALERGMGDSQLAGFERGVLRRGALRAHSGCYLIRIATPERTEAGDALAARLGKLVASGLPYARTPLPAVCRALPLEGMRAGSLRYFHTPESLDSVYYLADENLLGLGPDTRCALAAYNVEGEERSSPAVLLLVAYPDSQAATEGFQRFCRDYLLASSEDQRSCGGMIEDGSFVHAAVSESPPSLAIALDAAGPEWAEAMCARVLAAYEEEEQ